MSAPGLRLAVDATPLLGQRSGVGRYLAGLLRGLASLPDAPSPQLTVFSWRGPTPDAAVPGRPSRRRLPGRLLQPLWARVPFPPVEVLTGRIEVFHGGNYVLPPLWRAAGTVAVHDLTYLRYPETVDDNVRRYAVLVPDAVRRAARVVTGCEAIRDELCAQYRLDPDAVVVAPHGVDPAWFVADPDDARRRARLGLPERYLLFVGNVEPRKGLPLLVRAHAAARREHPEVPALALAGPAGWGQPLEGVELRPADVVRLGYLQEADLHSVVRGCVALCLPSRYEGFGLPVLEALAAGRPALASDIPAHREVAGGQATLLPAEDVQAWAHALVQVCAGADEPAAGAARQARAREFTWQRSAATHLRAWREVARGDPPSRSVARAQSLR